MYMAVDQKLQKNHYKGDHLVPGHENMVIGTKWFSVSLFEKHLHGRIFDWWWAQVRDQRVAEGTIKTFLQASENSDIATNCALTKAVFMLKKMYAHPVCFI